MVSKLRQNILKVKDLIHLEDGLLLIFHLFCMVREAIQKMIGKYELELLEKENDPM